MHILCRECVSKMICIQVSWASPVQIQPVFVAPFCFWFPGTSGSSVLRGEGGSHVLQPAFVLLPPPHTVTAGDLRVSLEVSTLCARQPCGDRNRLFFFFFKRMSRNVTVHLLKDVSVWFCQVWKVWCLVSVCVLGQQYDKTEAGLCLTAPLLHPVRAQNMSHTIHPLVLTSYGHPTHVDQGHSRHSDGPVI